MLDTPAEDVSRLSPIPASGEPEQAAVPLSREHLPRQRWHLFPPQPELAQQLAQATGLSALLAQVLINRGIDLPENAAQFLDPERQQLPSPLDEFLDLPYTLELLTEAIEQRQKIAICGDYDADGMTSTALLLRALRFLGADVDYAIPSRMSEGYGINERIVEEFFKEGVAVILTVDNGIAAVAPIARARELGLAVIVTDHHDIPPELPPANAILNPKLLPETSPYRGVAGVGVAYILAVCLAQALGKTQALTSPLLELFTLGTIADLAPLVGVNRRWVRRGLKLLARSRILGVQALVQVAGLSDQDKALKPEHIGFRLGPRINAVGRLSDPQVVIEMLTTDDVGVALERAIQCEQINQTRQELCQQIEQDAVAWCEAQMQAGKLDLVHDRVLVVVQPGWHHGVIGIVASRLVERYGVPVFIGTYEDEAQKEIRGSARGIPEFNVFEALQACGDLLDKFGGHKAAGGFSFAAKRLRQVKARLVNYANQQLQVDHLKPLVRVDGQARLADITLDLHDQIDQLHPCGIENADPVFWTPAVRVLEQQTVGRNRDHLKLRVAQIEPDGTVAEIKAIAWRWGEYYPLPSTVDLAYKLKLNEWQGNRSIELELVGARLPASSDLSTSDMVPPATATKKPARSKRSRVEPPTEAALPKDPLPTDPLPNPLPIEPPPLAAELPPAQTSLPPRLKLPLEPDSPSQTRAAARVAARVLREPSASARIDAAPAEPKTAIAPLETILTEPVPPSAVESAEKLPKNPVPDGADAANAESDGAPSSAVVDPEWTNRAEFFFSKRRYTAQVSATGDARELTIHNPEGQRLVVLLPERQGFLCVPGDPARPVDLSEPYYFNLVRAGLSALEIRQKTRLLVEKDELLAEKNNHIETLLQQVALLEQKLSQLSSEQRQQFQVLQQELKQQESAIQTQEAHIAELQSQMGPAPTIDPQAIKRQVRQAVGDKAWYCLTQASQKDLYAAYKHQAIIQAEQAEAALADYSEAGLRLGFAVEREVIQPFFRDLYEFLLAQGSPEVGGLLLGPHKKYTLGMLPPLLAQEWTSFKDRVLKTDKSGPPKGLYAQSRAGGQMSGPDRTALNQFLQQWEHPISTWFGRAPVEAASCIDQVSKLRNIAAHAESVLYGWHYDLLRQQVLGDDNQAGLFQNIYGR